ncbi:hypothetical protein [Aequorivita lipolytica]|uniref:Cell division protein ZapB n=1 Tax=Aequorivita lipolytica TaxID=153267 RepID=A0A5C6YLT1_9FLAO|nr:hypothetical protein [Aequorivita lipolytica]TXD67962.1 hypothetical protein ESV24_14310 [Aequorivita lipolytica]SRX51492.1 hypothetical protein AEQU2_01975 [Aequorivita lipolytica]
MSTLSEIVDSLENRIGELLKRHEILKNANVELAEELNVLQSKQQQFEDEIEAWTEKCNSLKLANSMLGSDQHKRETKLKINALVREIDQCITQLSE